jgi:hypothetical protein
MTNQKMVQTKNVSACLYNIMPLQFCTGLGSSSRKELYCNEVCDKFCSLWLVTRHNLLFLSCVLKLVDEILNWNVFDVN